MKNVLKIKNPETGEFEPIAAISGADGAPGANGQGVPTGGTAGQILRKTGSGDYEAAWNDKAGDSEKLGGVAAAQYALNNNVPAHNLLDNSDFTHPVNQRGAETANAYSYFIDRWCTGGKAVSFTLSQNGITINNQIRQYIGFNRIAGKTITLAAKIDGNVYCCSGTIPSTNGGSWTVYATTAISKGKIFIASDSAEIAQIRIDGTSDTEILVEWIALYEGSYDASTLPAYQPKGYAAELAECMRYYENSWFGADKTKNLEMHGIAYKSTGLDVWVKYRVPKRIVATVTLYPVEGTDGWRIYKEQAYRNLDTVSARYKYHDGFLLNATKGSEDTTTWTDGDAMLVYGHWEASADL